MPKRPVVITQKQLEQAIKSTAGISMQTPTGKKDKDGEEEMQDLILRSILIGVIYTPDEDREPDEKLRGFSLAQKIATKTGEIKLNEQEIELILDRANKNEFLNLNDHVYGVLNEVLDGAFKGK